MVLSLKNSCVSKAQALEKRGKKGQEHEMFH